MLSQFVDLIHTDTDICIVFVLYLYCICIIQVKVTTPYKPTHIPTCNALAHTHLSHRPSNKEKQLQHTADKIINPTGIP